MICFSLNCTRQNGDGKCWKYTLYDTLQPWQISKANYEIRIHWVLESFEIKIIEHSWAAYFTESLNSLRPSDAYMRQ